MTSAAAPSVSQWVKTRLRFLASIKNSNVDKKSYEGQKSVRLCNYTDVYYNERITSADGLMEATASDAEIQQFQLRSGDVIITKDSETPDDIGIPALVERDLPGVVCGYHLTMLRVKGPIVPEFLFRTLQSVSIRQYFEAETPGVTRFGLDQDTIKSTPIFLPPIEEQRRICIALNRQTSRIDGLIAKKTRFIALLRDKRQALITQAVTKGLNASAPTKSSRVEWLGAIPAHWDVVQSRRLFSERNQKANNGERQLTVSQKHGVIAQSDFMELEGRRVVQVVKGHEILKHVEAGDFVMSMRSFQGGLELSQLSGAISSAYVPLAPIKWVDHGYFRYLFKSSTYIQALQSTSDLVRDGQALRFENFSKIALPVIPIEEQRAISQYLDRATSRIDALVAKTECSINLLNEHRAALITAAVTGKIDVREAA